jgi:regulation of enolase protein 1 (concanavalin A-like superfamily)
MPKHNTVTITTLPVPLRWHGDPQQWDLATDNTLTITAGQQTDWFIDPDTGTTICNAPALLMEVHEPCMLTALVGADHIATFDAGVLAIYQSSQVWAKLCLELSPEGQVTIVSVVTRGASDDCNSVPIAGNSAHLRLAKLDQAYAFHYSPDGTRWSLIRYFTLGESPGVEIGFLAQSPTGMGCTARFREIIYRHAKLKDVRSGE